MEADTVKSDCESAPKAKKQGRLNKSRKKINKFICCGFEKLPEQHSLGLDLVKTHGRGHCQSFIRYRRMKLIATLFAVWGILAGVFLILVAYNYRALIPENKSFFLTDLDGEQENKAEIEVCVADTGRVVTI